MYECIMYECVMYECVWHECVLRALPRRAIDPSMTAPLATNHLTMSPSDDPRRGRTRRWIVIGLVSVLAHLVLLDALPRFEREPGGLDEEPLRARLVPLPAAVPDATPPPAPVPRAEPRATQPVPRPRPKPMAEADFVPESLTSDVSQVTTSAPHLGPASAPRAPPPALTTTPDVPAPAPPPPPTAVAPQSVRLAYKVTAVDRKNASPINYYGIGSIDWANDGTRYRSDLQAAVDFLLFKANVLASHSEGAIARQGLLPDRYTETPRRKATLATNFNRDQRQTISFSASTATFGLVAGVQDRETWTFDAQGVESVETGDGAQAALHLRRVPKPDSNDRTIDVWITQAEGFPARVLYTEPNGSTIDMTLDRVEALPRKDADFRPPAPG
jgi:hypothetical protein